MVLRRGVTGFFLFASNPFRDVCPVKSRAGGTGRSGEPRGPQASPEPEGLIYTVRGDPGFNEGCPYQPTLADGWVFVDEETGEDIPETIRTASVRVGNNLDGYNTVWRQKVLRGEAFSLPTGEKTLAHWSAWRYEEGAGCGSQKTESLGIAQHTVFDYDAKVRRDSVTVTGIEGGGASIGSARDAGTCILEITRNADELYRAYTETHDILVIEKADWVEAIWNAGSLPLEIEGHGGAAIKTLTGRRKSRERFSDGLLRADHR